MIDTVVLTLTKDMYTISDPHKFQPSAVWALSTSHAAKKDMQSKQNPTKKELLAGIYKPRLTIAYRINPSSHKASPGTSTQVMLKIEVSLPKLFYGNNFQELKGKDLAPLLQKLSSILNQMGVIIAPSCLSAAPISAVHYSKNIPLTDGSTPYHYINKIKEANIKLSLDVNQTDYRNEGHIYKWHCNSYEVVFYDKIKDLEKARMSDKRALEKDNAVQLHLFKEFEKRKKFEILRMEVRLNKRAKIKSLFKRLGIKSNLSLKSLFKPLISKKILLHYLDELESKRPPLLDYKAGTDKALLADLILNNPELGSKRILQMYGLSKALESMNIRELREMFPKYKQRSWHRLMSEIRDLKLSRAQSPFETIRGNIIKFKALRIN